ncbi:permease-like cell division protein FtsX [Marinobacterium arenosum]|uniref:permease-like cell division protein FtsX n=1 Tax=Marinobacterium arenosum TaxID=2862496 RepID=UPI001C97DB77|nr:permease-like cell division protein FtsX [Marinobacterium arenosum]MBY4678630.1 permease-like cell division protein FtsX [Marinobacterium arenosum]
MAKPQKEAPRRRGAERIDRQTGRMPVGECGIGQDRRRSRFTEALRFDSNSHWQTARTALRRLFSTPAATLMTMAVLAIALALPGVLFAGLKNVQQLALRWEGEPRIALYLQPELQDAAADRFSRSLLLRDDLRAVELISREQGIAEFRELSGFGDVLDYLGSNPIPAVISVLPRSVSAAELTALREQLQALPEVEEAALDMAWVQRLNGALQVAQRAVLIVALLLASAVLLVVGNTVRVAIESRRDEIVVAKLVGATDGWVQRPFLYTGGWYGLFGGLLAWCLVQFSLMLLDTPVRQLADLYQSPFNLLGLGVVDSLLLLLISIGLGLGGAWLAVNRYLRQIEPE